MAPVMATKPLNLLLPSSPAILMNWVGVNEERSGRSITNVDAGAADLRGLTITISGAVSGVAAMDLRRRGAAAMDLRRRAARRPAGRLRCSSSMVLDSRLASWLRLCSKEMAFRILVLVWQLYLCFGNCAS